MPIPIQLAPDSPEPLYHQIEEQLRALIVSGQLEEGAALPSIRELASDLACSVITIRRVYQDLEQDGLLRTRQGTGTFVARISEEEKQKHVYGAVRDAFREAVTVGRRVHFSDEEMRIMLENVLQEDSGTRESGN